jgi:hypothetical protein
MQYHTKTHGGWQFRLVICIKIKNGNNLVYYLEDTFYCRVIMHL